MIFSNDKVEIVIKSNNTNKPIDMKAFLYSNEDMKITGSTGHITINGGVSGRSIELTAMRGSETSNWKASCKTIGSIKNCQNIADLMELWNNASEANKAAIEKEMRSRLTVNYNPDIIDTYEEHAVDAQPKKPPELKVSAPSDYDRSKK